MAHSTLPVLPNRELPRSPYDGHFIDRLVRLAEKAITRAELSPCVHESPESKKEND